MDHDSNSLENEVIGKLWQGIKTEIRIEFWLDANTRTQTESN